jgi:cob(I)alamin adenosyltransferase
MSIATKTGDQGQTGLIGGARVSKADLRVESYGTVDELIASLGWARAVCEDDEIKEKIKAIQGELFQVNATLATVPDGKRTPPEVTDMMIDGLTNQVAEIEAMDDIFADWAVPGDYAPSAAIDVARTICRRAERCVVRLLEENDDARFPLAMVYLNRLSDLLWLYGRLMEIRAGINSKLRGETAGRSWSKAW